ncbi:MAG: GNAT family N-acetyltransferase [bacterium]
MQISYDIVSEFTDDFRYLALLFQKQYEKRYKETFDFLDSFQKKILDSSKKTVCVLMYDASRPVAFAFYEEFSDFYGSISLYSSRKVYCRKLATFVYQQGYFKDYLLELICYDHDPLYRLLFRQFGLVQNHRQRMSLELFKDEYFSDLSLPYFVKPLTENDLKTSSYLSYLSHQISRDYYMYPGMNNKNNRYALEKLAFNGHYGPCNRAASFFICKEDEILGYCIVVDVACWGQKRVPWIFDISVRPEFLGKGIGRMLMQHALNTMVKEKLKFSGLAVTKTNTVAISLYESLGFRPLDEFYEYIEIT